MAKLKYFITLIFVMFALIPLKGLSLELSEEENKSYARICNSSVKKVLSCTRLERELRISPLASVVEEMGGTQKSIKLNHGKTFRYATSKVLSLSPSGANVSTLIYVNHQCTSDGNNGWSEPITRSYETKFECKSLGSARGQFQEPELLVELNSDNNEPYRVYTRTISKPNPSCPFGDLGMPKEETDYTIASKSSKPYFKNECVIVRKFGLKFLKDNYPNYDW